MLALTLTPHNAINSLSLKDEKLIRWRTLFGEEFRERKCTESCGNLEPSGGSRNNPTEYREKKSVFLIILLNNFSLVSDCFFFFLSCIGRGTTSQQEDISVRKIQINMFWHYYNCVIATH